MKNLILIVAVSLFCAGCVTTGGQKNKDGKNKHTIRLGSKFEKYNESEKTIWLAYGYSLIGCEADHNPVSFEYEVCARSSILKIWKKLKSKNDHKSKHLDELIKVYDAGYLREYVWQRLRKPYWFSPQELKIKKFLDWEKSKLPDHEPNVDPGVYISKEKIQSVQPKIVRTRENKVYPESIGDFEFAGETNYNMRDLGRSIRYVNHKVSNTYFDVYLYDIPKNLTKGNRLESLTTELSNVKAGIYYQEDRGIYSRIVPVHEKVLTLKGREYKLLAGVYKLQKGTLAIFSSAYQSIISDKFIKIRVTYPDNEYYEKSDHFLSVVKQVLSKFDAVLARKDMKP